MKRSQPWRKTDKKGRSKGDAFHVRLYGWMMESPAWAALSPAERCTYLEVERRYFGENNGQIGLSVRKAAESCRVSKDTAAKALQRLVELGFIECVTPGGFSRKTRHAAEWRLTRASCDVTKAPASKAFMHWRPDLELGPKSGTLLSENKDTRQEKAA